MKALLIEPYNKVSEIEVENTLDEFQRLVDGYIEPIYEGEYIILVNEEGRLMGLPHNIMGLVGNIVIVRNGGEEFESLSDEDITYLKDNIIQNQ